MSDNYNAAKDNLMHKRLYKPLEQQKQQALTNQILINVRSHTLFYNICLLTCFHIKIFVHVDEAENVLHAFYKWCFFGSASVCL